MTTAEATRSGILVIRLGAMGDIIHTLPAAASLKLSFPDRKLAWLAAPRWIPLLQDNPFIDNLIPFERSNFAALKKSWSRLAAIQPKWAFDFQGLVQSALAGLVARPDRFYGFHKSVAREAISSFFFTDRICVEGPHRVQRNLQLAAAAGATHLTYEAWIPPGQPEATLPTSPFVLANPFAGWPGKEWPLESYDHLAERLSGEGLAFVVNVSEGRARELATLKRVHIHTSTIAGLIDATRRAAAVVGVDSGPLHLAAALHKPGVGLYGPTDPACTGPFGGSMTVLRAPHVETTYKRHPEIHASMRATSVDEVAEALLRSIAGAAQKAAGHAKGDALAVSRP